MKSAPYFLIIDNGKNVDSTDQKVITCPFLVCFFTGPSQTHMVLVGANVFYGFSMYPMDENVWHRCG